MKTCVRSCIYTPSKCLCFMY